MIWKRLSSRLAAVMPWCIAALIILPYCVLLVRSTATRFDDAYMLLRYANNMLQGKGFAWNPDGVQTYGATSLIYLLVVAAFRLVSRLDGGVLLAVLSWAFGALLFATVVLTCLRSTRSPILHSVPVATVVCLAPVVPQSMSRFHAMTGMDTMFAAFCNALLILAVLSFIRERTPRRFIWMCLAAYLSYAARPDNILYVVLFPVLGILLLARDRTYAWKFVVTISALLLFDAGVKYAIFGYVWPLAAYVKQHGYYEAYIDGSAWNPVSFLSAFLTVVMPFIWLLIIAGSYRTLTIVTVLMLPVALTFFYYFTIAQIMGFQARYYYPSLPFWIVAAVLVIDDVLAEDVIVAGSRTLIQKVLYALLVSIGLHMLAPRVADAYAANVLRGGGAGRSVTVEQARRVPQLGWWRAITEMSAIAKRLPAGTTVAASEVGYLGASAPQVTLIDLAGLNDNFLAHHGFSIAYVMERKPDLIWFPNTNIGVRDVILRDEVFWREYDYYCDAYEYGIGVRRNTEFSKPMQQLLVESWERNYPAVAMQTCARQAPHDILGRARLSALEPTEVVSRALPFSASFQSWRTRSSR